jgi:outer membrane protein assembly factor BamB/tetratricopeptide (TPR) repeat protein
MDLAGKTLGQFRIIEQLGQGGMASVFKAYQPSLDRYVAIKVLPAQHALTPGFSERFVREARAIAQLNHPNILPVIDFGQEGDLSYIVMKYVPAGTLTDKMGHPMALEEVTRLVEGIAAALDHAHERGILHRDVKPSNVLLDEGDWVLLADFGLAKMMAGDEELTGSGVGIGTPAYMSPEQGQGKDVDARTDIYALGVVLYEMLVGQLPFDAETPFAIVMKHITEPLPLPSSLRPDLPEVVERVILKALAKAPADRFATAGELARALRAANAVAAPIEPAATVEPLAETLDSLPELYTQALGYFYTEQWEKAIKAFERIVAVQPDYEHGDAARRLEQARGQQGLTELYTQAEAALAREDWETGITCLSEIIATDADYRDAEVLLQQARGRKELADLYGDAQRLHGSGQWQAVINVWKRIHTLDPDYSDPDGLLASARSELEQLRAEMEAQRQAEERSRRLADLYRRGLAHVTADEWREAAALFEEIESLEPGYQETPALLDRARREVIRLEATQTIETEPERRRLASVRTTTLALWRKRWPFLLAGLASVVVIGAIILFVATSGSKAPAIELGEDGRAVAATLDQPFVSDRDGKREIYRVDRSGQIRRWTHSPAGSESWSPVLGSDGKLFFTSNRDGKREIYRMDTSGEVLRWTNSPADSESWGPALRSDGALFFTSNRDGKPEIYRMQGSGEVMRWTHTPGDGRSWSPVLAPDGTFFFTSDRDGKREIYRMQGSGEVMRWTDTPGQGESWSPGLGSDGKLFFTSNRDGKREIYRMERSGEVLQWTHTRGDAESWAPVVGNDGQLFFTSDRDGKPEVYVMDRSGQALRLTHTPGRGASWLSDTE